MDTSLAGNVVVLTGASAGIGRALALQLAGAGASLVLGARDLGALEEVAAACRARGARAIARRTDVGDEAQCRTLVEVAAAEHGRIDTLVNNAGVSSFARFEDVKDLSMFERIMRVNYLGAVYTTFHALPWIVRARGRLVAVSSVAGMTGVPTRTAYAASKHALVGFFDSLRIELAPKGVSVTVVCPDFVATEIRERALGPDGATLGRGNSPVREAEVMTAEACARRIARAIARRERQVLMSARSRVGVWLKVAAPGLMDRIAAGAIARGK